MVGALGGAVQRKMLFDDSGAHDIADERHGNTVIVRGKADHHIGEPLAEGLDDLEVQLAEFRRIA
ncbi:hypothetical protein BMS3Bbin10_00232 [bacterium BMS3Bbin10]|nr:hypothetical protein BMS3Bbin10_00232 [bacterium BMS3Bbin10]